MVGTMHTGGGNIRLTYLCAEQLFWSHWMNRFANMAQSCGTVGSACGQVAQKPVHRTTAGKAINGIRKKMEENGC